MEETQQRLFLMASVRYMYYLMFIYFIRYAVSIILDAAISSFNVIRIAFK